MARRARGRTRERQADPDRDADLDADPRRHPGPAPDEPAEREQGPFDATELDLEQTDAVGRLDFGSVRVPWPYDARLQIESAPGGRLKALHVLVPGGRLTISALAAPRSAPLWPGLSEEIVANLRKDGTEVRWEHGQWGREVMASTPTAQCLFIGVDGPRWMLYGVATGPAEGVGELTEVLRDMIRGTIVVRDEQAFPVRTVLPLTPPPHLSARLEHLPDEGPAAGPSPPGPVAPDVPNARHPEHSNPGSPYPLSAQPPYPSRAQPPRPQPPRVAPPRSAWVAPPPSAAGGQAPGRPVRRPPPRRPVAESELPTPPGWRALGDPRGDPLGNPLPEPPGDPLGDPLGNPLPEPPGDPRGDPLGNPLPEPPADPLADPPGVGELPEVGQQPASARLTDDPLSWILPDLDRPAGRHRRPD